MKEYLPIGSVVLLNEGSKPLMIYGYKQLAVKTRTEYDYIACFYPEGNISNEHIYLFNNQDINTVLYKGYENPTFKKLNEFLSNLNQAYISETLNETVN